METTKRHYSPEFKIKAVELSKHKGALKSVSAELGIPNDNLRRWVREYDSGKFSSENVTHKVKSKEEEELIRLKKELYETKMERDILKKAVGIFSKSDR